jgi:hypothetical protein
MWFSEFPPMAELNLTAADFVRAAAALSTDVAAIRAVVEIEAAGSGFLPDGRPKILYEAHVFHRVTGGRFDSARDRHGVAVSVRQWNRALYGASGAHQYERLDDAAALDWDGAHKACSWGAAQILGTNFKAAGFADIRSFVDAMQNGGAGAHLDAMVSFLKANRLDDALRRHDWAPFARGYNGPAYKTNRYDEKLAAAYRRWAAQA